MVEFVNKLTGGAMWVHESRVDEYKAAGHKLAAEFFVKQEEAPKPAQRKRNPAKAKK